MDLPPKRVEEFLHQRIPIAKAINCQVLDASDKCLTLALPKFVNTVADEEYSDLSLVTLCKLSSWAFLQVSLQRLDFRPLTSLSHAAFSKRREIDPNTHSIRSTCCLPGEREWQQFLRMLSRKARARVCLMATLSDDLGDTSALTCEYDTRDLDPA